MALKRSQDSKPINKTHVIPLGVQRKTGTWKCINNANFMGSKPAKYLKTSITKDIKYFSNKTLKVGEKKKLHKWRCLGCRKVGTDKVSFSLNWSVSSVSQSKPQHVVFIWKTDSNAAIIK